MFDPSKHIESYTGYVHSGASYDEDAQDRGYNLPNILFNELHMMIGKGWRILDVGCGSGLSGERFRSPDSELVGVDGCEELLEVARQKQLYTRLEHVVIGKDQFPCTNHDFHISLALSVMAHFPLASTLPSLLQQATCPRGLVVFNYIDAEDFSGTDFITDASGGIIGAEDRNADVPCYYHRYEDIKNALNELCLRDHYCLPCNAYQGVLGGGRTHVVVAQYMPENA